VDTNNLGLWDRQPVEGCGGQATKLDGRRKVLQVQDVMKGESRRYECKDSNHWATCFTEAMGPCNSLIKFELVNSCC
jgi:hypothetical protein